MSLTIRVLGPLSVSVDGRPVEITAARLRTLLVALALSADEVVSVDRLAGIVWDERPPAHVRRTVQTYVTRLRQVLGPQAIVTSPVGYRLAVDPQRVDAVAFERFLDIPPNPDDPAAERASLVRALALWRGIPFDGLQSSWLAAVESVRLTERYLAAVERRIDLDLESDAAAELVAELQDLTARHPLRERLWGQLMTALDRGGRQADALAAYQRLYRMLADELGIEPGHAVQRLHHQILTGSSDPGASSRALSHSSAVPRQLPAEVAPFVGRARELADLNRLCGVSPATSIVVDGMAGVGKTTLAVHWAHRVADRFPDGQLFVNLCGFHPLGQVMTASDALRGFLEALDVPPQRIPSTLDAQVALYRSVLADRRMLILLDNARDAEQVRPLLPGSPSCLVVVTSRNELTGLVAAEAARPLMLDLLSSREARRVLVGRLGADRVAAEPRAAEDIIASCGRLPLALSIVAARAAVRPKFPLAALAAELAEPPHRLDALAGTDEVTDLRTVLGCSYRTLSTAAARMFRLLGLHPGPEVSTAAAASLAGVGKTQARATLAELSQLHLLTEISPSRYAFHDLLRAYAVELVNAEEPATERQCSVQRMYCHYLHSALTAGHQLNPHRVHQPGRRTSRAELPVGVIPESPGDTGQALAWLAAEHQVLRGTLAAMVRSGLDDQAIQLAWAIDGYLARSGRRSEWADNRLTALRAVRRLGDRLEIAWAHRGLARAYRELGRFADAREQLSQALPLFIELGDEAGAAHAHLSLGQIHEMQGDFASAHAYALQALAVFRSIDDVHGVSTALNAVGWCQAQLGEPDAGLATCEEALILQRKTGDRYGEAGTLDSLSVIHLRLGVPGRAIDCCGEALSLHRDNGDRFAEAQTLIQLGACYQALGDPGTAARSLTEAITILDDLGRPEADDARLALQELTLQSGR
ncbi:MAG: tetratricopeptide repeat protein [Hamadaea sp.]|uniref:AfsR/SARP family transcriptional regulator n=1 Tax=Hamadaea sp. TaxID=2024425 RepID=UPI00182D0F4F|nr:BTAD domain-containing putative transcriptional regulator [Hamadaea sp.]NUT18779.1 tetratricopeptide repeat protein [Hamadaea sp.]